MGKAYKDYIESLKLTPDKLEILLSYRDRKNQVNKTLAQQFLRGCNQILKNVGQPEIQNNSCFCTSTDRINITTQFFEIYDKNIDNIIYE